MSDANRGFMSSFTITRPANATPYTAGDVVGMADASVAANAGNAILPFTAVGTRDGVALITEASVLVGADAVPAGMTTFRLHLYNKSPTAILDNAAWDLPAGDRVSYIGYIDIESATDVGGSVHSQTDQVTNGTMPKMVKLDPGANTLYGQLVTTGGFTPASGTTVKVTISGVAY